MKLITLLSACKPLGIGAVSVAVVGTGAGIGLNALHAEDIPNTEPEVVAVEEVTTPVEELANEEAKEEPKTNTEETPKTETPKAEEKKVSTSTTKQTATPSTTTTPKQETVKYSILGHKPLHAKAGHYGYFDDNGVQYNTDGSFTSVLDFEKAAKGICPKDIPEGAWSQKLHPAATLGYTMDDYQAARNIPMGSLRVWNNIRWEEYPQRNIGSQVVFAEEFGLYPKGNDGIDELSLVFEINWSSYEWTVDWRRAVEDSVYKGKVGIGSNATKLMDNATSQLTKYFNSYEKQYRHCRY